MKGSILVQRFIYLAREIVASRDGHEIRPANPSSTGVRNSALTVALIGNFAKGLSKVC